MTHLDNSDRSRKEAEQPELRSTFLNQQSLVNRAWDRAVMDGRGRG